MPSASQRAISAPMSLDDSSMMVLAVSVVSRRMASTTAKPSMCGICASSSTNAKGWLRCAASRISCSACSPSPASTGCIFQLRRISARIIRLVWLSSTTSTDMFSRPLTGGVSTIAAACGTPNCAVKWKVVPTPGVLSTQTVPCISSTSCATIDSPSPVPPYSRVVEVSAWANA